MLFFFQCSKDVGIQNNKVSTKYIEHWTEIEVLSQKFTAEKKWNDTLKCFIIHDNLNVEQRDSILKYYSYHPEVLKIKIDSLINKNTN